MSSREAGWVLVVPKDAGWLDKTRRPLALGDEMGFPLTCSAAPAREQQPALVREALENGAARLELQALQENTQYLERKPAEAMRAAAARLLNDAGVQDSGLLNDLPTKWEKLGDVALVPSNALTDPRWAQVGCERVFQAVAAAIGVARLARQAAVDSGEMRESRAVMLWPEGAPGWTEFRENGVTYSLDVTKVMFSSGNGTEKARMGKVARKGEVVVDLYAGIGYYTLQMLVHAGVARVFACEWNPNSVEALRRNLESNRVSDRCQVLHGDNREHAPKRVADRVLLGLLPSSEPGWRTAAEALRDEGGWLHVHGNVRARGVREWAANLATTFEELFREGGRSFQVRVDHVEEVKWYAPHILHVVADLHCLPGPSGGSAASAGGAAAGSQDPAGGAAGGGSSAAAPASDGAAGASGREQGQTAGMGERCAAGEGGPGPLLTLHRPTREELAAGPSAQRRPALLAGFDLGPAVTQWSPEYLASHPEAAAAKVSVHVSSTPVLDFVQKNFKFENMTLAEMVRRAAAGGTGGGGEGEASTSSSGGAASSAAPGQTHLYLRSVGENPRREPANLAGSFPGLARELSVPPVFPEAEFFASVLRVSSPGLTLWCEGKGEPRTHYDAMDNILIQVTGEKRVLLFHPADIGCLYMEGSSSRVVDVDMKESAADTARRFPRFAAARRRALEVRLRPGDVLFIPALWPHHVRAEGFSVSVNVFWRHFPADLSPKKDLYGNRDPLAAEAAAAAADTVVQRLLELPADTGARQFYLRMILASIEERVMPGGGGDCYLGAAAAAAASNS